MKTSKFEVLAIVWSDEEKKQVKVVVGEFDRRANAKLFADAYSTHYSSNTEIVEYKKV